MIDRREFLRRSAIIAGGAVAADQLEIYERLTARKIFASPFPRTVGEIQLLDANGGIWRRIPYNGEPLHAALRGYERTRWLRLRLDSPTDWQRAITITGSSHNEGADLFTLPYDMSAPDPQFVRRLLFKGRV